MNLFKCRNVENLLSSSWHLKPIEAWALGTLETKKDKLLPGKMQVIPGEEFNLSIVLFQGFKEWLLFAILLKNFHLPLKSHLTI